MAIEAVGSRTAEIGQYQSNRAEDVKKKEKEDDIQKNQADESAQPKREPRYDEYIKGADRDEKLPDKLADKDKKALEEPEGGDGDKETKCTCNTDDVDAEIKKLKEEKSKIEQEIARAGDDKVKVDQLKSRLAQVESELSAKDNDTYRKQNAEFTMGTGYF